MSTVLTFTLRSCVFCLRVRVPCVFAGLDYQTKSSLNLNHTTQKLQRIEHGRRCDFHPPLRSVFAHVNARRKRACGFDPIAHPWTCARGVYVCEPIQSLTPSNLSPPATLMAPAIKNNGF